MKENNPIWSLKRLFCLYCRAGPARKVSVEHYKVFSLIQLNHYRHNYAYWSDIFFFFFIFKKYIDR